VRIGERSQDVIDGVLPQYKKSAKTRVQVFLNAVVVTETFPACRLKENPVSILPIATSSVLAGQSVIRQTIAVGSGQAQDSAPESSTAVSLSKNAQAWAESEARFDRYRHRISPYACNFFTRDDRKVIGEAYEIAEGLAAKRGELVMKKIDKLVNELAVFRIQQHMRGELVMLAVRQAYEDEHPDEPYQVDLAHLPLLGKIREMTGAGG
jgi:hypothetical protein